MRRGGSKSNADTNTGADIEGHAAGKLLRKVFGRSDSGIHHYPLHHRHHGSSSGQKGGDGGGAAVGKNCPDTSTCVSGEKENEGEARCVLWVPDFGDGGFVREMADALEEVGRTVRSEMGEDEEEGGEKGSLGDETGLEATRARLERDEEMEKERQRKKRIAVMMAKVREKPAVIVSYVLPPCEFYADT